MQLVLRQRPQLRPVYKGFEIHHNYGRVFAIPSRLVQQYGLIDNKILSHPSVLSAPCIEELTPQLDSYDDQLHQTENLGIYRGYTLLRYQGIIYAIPENGDTVNHHLSSEQEQWGVIRGDQLEKVQQKIDEVQQKTPIEFAGWMTIFRWAGNCGQHPQFRHIESPPDGYRFTVSEPPVSRKRTLFTRAVSKFNYLSKKASEVFWSCTRPLLRIFQGGPRVGLRNRLKVYSAMTRLFFQLHATGAGILPILRFLQSRHFQSQLLMMRSQGLAFLPSMPFTYGQKPWVIEIEDATTLFFPFVQNGGTSKFSMRDSPYYPIIKSMLEADHCKGIITHMKATADMVPRFFDSEIIRKKLFYAPLGVNLPVRYQRHEPQNENETINLLFINSWCQAPANFFLRGGLDVLEAFSTLHQRYPQLRLTIRTNFPPLDHYFYGLMEKSWVRVIQRFMTAEEIAELHAESHIFLLPAARIHILSLLQAMSYGLAVVTSDGWGIKEYVTHDRNGLIVPGRYGTASWTDEEAAQLRENYEPTYTSDPVVVQGIIDAVSRLVEDHELRARLGRTARADVKNHFHLEGWNGMLKKALDQATNGETIPAPQADPTRKEDTVLVTGS